jgi:heme-degrading monooxygenase HmoA
MSQFVTVHIFRARAGDEDAVVALHEDWQRHLRPRTDGYISGELLSAPDDPRAFISLTRYESEAASRAAANDPEQAAWYRRLRSLLEDEPAVSACTSAWCSEPDPGGMSATAP